MPILSIAHIVVIATVVLASNKVLSANELRGPLEQRDTQQVIIDAELDYKRGFAVDAASIGDTDGVLYSGYVAPAGPCVCTNLNNVTVICKDCDDATDEARCVMHDRACRDAALAGGIREHTSFFCTTTE